MKKIFKGRKIHIACVCLLLVMLLAGCDLLKPPIEYGIEYGRNYIKHLMGLHGLVILMMGLNSLWEMKKMNRFEKQGFLKTHG